jgi:6-phosphofructokinase
MKTTITSTYVSNEGTQVINTSTPPEIIMNGIRSFVVSQLKQNLNNDPSEEDIRMVTNGFIMFNQTSNRDMLTSREKLAEYLNDDTVSIEERKYVSDILLHIQRPNFVTAYDLVRCSAVDGLGETVFSLVNI